MRRENAIAIVDVESGGGASAVIRFVYSSAVREFTDEVCAGLLDGRLRSDADFSLGFIAAVNAMMLDTIDFADPVATVRQAAADVQETSGAMRKVTDCLIHYCETIGDKA